MRIPRTFVLAASAIVLLAAACRAPGSIDEPLDLGTASDSTPAPGGPIVPPAPSLLVLCLGEEPSSLYLYSAPSPEAQTIFQAIYDGPFDILGYEYRPVVLESAPSLSNGGARLEPATVSGGDLYFNPETRLPDTLTQGQTYAPSGCTGPDCLQPYQGGDVSMDRMVAEFRILEGVTWSDGESVTSEDSVFSFQLNADGRTPGSKDLVYRTASYEAVDDRTVRWTGIPGYLDPEIAAHFWSPLPKHVLSALPVVDLPTAEASAVRPMGWGPYEIASRVPGSSISLTRNPNYFRADGGLPVYDELLIRFVGRDPETVVQQVLTGECDVVDESALGEDAWPLLLQQEAQGRLKLAAVPGPRMMRADFLQPNAPIFRDVSTRQALAECSDRQGWLTRNLGGLGVVPASYLPPNHPLADPDVRPSLYDPQAAAAALEAAGWVEEDGSTATPRIARGVAGVPDGTRLAWRIGVAPGGLDEAWAEQLVADFAACGAEVSLDRQAAADLFAPYPDGPAFGGHLGMVVWSWFGWVTPACDVFASWEIPSADVPEGSNASGFSDPAFDAACRAVLFSPGPEGAAVAAAGVTQRVFVEQLPALPLAVLPRVAAVAPGVCGLEADPSPVSLLADLETLAPCPP